METFYDNLIQLIESVPEIAKDKAKLNSLKHGKKNIKKTISGAITNPLSKKMSLDDTECRRILKMPQGHEKTKEMSVYCQKVIDEALDNLSTQVRDAMNDQLEDISDYLNDIVEEQEKAFLNLKEKFEEMCLNDSATEEQKEQHCVMPLIIIVAAKKVESVFQ